MKQELIIILHGWNLSAKNYFNLKSILETQGYRVKIPDLPGFGKAITPDNPFSLADYENFIYSLLKREKIQSIILIGHSFGGRIALKLAADYPLLIKKMILTGVPAVIPAKQQLKIMFFKILANIGNKVFNFLFLNFLGKNSLRKILYKFAGSSDYLKTEGVMRETFKKIIGENLTQLMKKIRCPVMLIWGKEDKITNPQIGREMSRKIQNSKIIVVNSTGHSFIFKNPRLFVKIVTPFLTAEK